MQILDNLIPSGTQQRWFDMLDDRDWRWNYRRDITHMPDQSVPDFFTNERTSGYYCPLFYQGNSEFQNVMPWCYQILDNMTERTGVKVNELIRIQANLLYQNPSKTFNENSWNSAHVDNQAEHKVLLYYVNTCDGDTFMFNERCGETFDKLTIKQRVTPEMGRAILFDGHQYHASSNPIKSFKRYAINFNFV